MRSVWHGLLALLLVFLTGAFVRAGQTPGSVSVAGQLDRYLQGDFDTVVAELASLEKLDDLLKQLKRDGPAWVDAGGLAERRRRVLAAATYAMEATHSGGNTREWKWVQQVRLNMGTRARLTAADALYWKAPALMLEWGCELLRSEATPHPEEHTWQLAALAAAQLVGDYEFLVGSPFAPRGDPDDEIDHLKHVIARFPDEPRFALGQAIAVEWATYPNPPRTSQQPPRLLADATRAFTGMTRDEAIGPEASLRLGSVRLRGGNTAGALELFAKVESTTRDPYLVYLARFFAGQAYEKQQKRSEAELAYRSALRAVPYAQSASIALAALLYTSNRPAEAATLTKGFLSAQPQVFDPWREYGAADHRFWPELIARLRTAIAE